jgi:hypothetical protein
MIASLQLSQDCQFSCVTQSLYANGVPKEAAINKSLQTSNLQFYQFRKTTKAAYNQYIPGKQL